MAGQSQLHAAAQRGAMQRHDHWLGQLLEFRQHMSQQRQRHRAREFADVGAGNEGASGAIERHGPDAAVLRQAAGDLEQAAAHGGRDGIDGRVIDSNDGDAVLDGDGDGLAQRALLAVDAATAGRGRASGAF
jgi:hypothetical protein